MTKRNEKALSPEQREALLRALKARFEKNMNRHKVMNGPKYKQSWKRILQNCGPSMKWKELAVNRMLLVMIKRRANTFFMIVLRKVRKAAERLVTTVGRRKSEKRQEVTLLIWQRPWASSF